MLYARKYYLCNRFFSRWHYSELSVRCPIPPTSKAVALDEWRLATKKEIENFEEECFNNDGDFVDSLLYPYYNREDLKASKKNKKRKNNKC